ncbi:MULTISPECIES: RDD family protein [Ectothiorhodospira]|uniref:RDD family protein n=1 Tax=Ectothiorhodospira TaxID=1051 RepID=UPI001905168D|nr:MULTISPECIES: RDD family protein [Ectothiorhodospira]MCG5501713.1 RDD family protein [Ectothiorhodospira lacustris]MCG5508663.1 RDD family protein [Ectothiorhodospira lacustris]MCG5520454.1 RDD family protein [Ectothiorhodospira lacustris]
MYCTQCGHNNDHSARFCAGCGASLGTQPLPADMAEGAGAAAAPASASVRDAGFWYRLLAFVIDMVILTLITIVVAVPLGFALGASMAASGATGQEITLVAEGMGNLLSLLLGWLYYTVFESSKWQSTPGKRMLGLRVTDMDGNRIGFGRANGRYWSKILSALLLFIGYLMIAFTRRKQGLHDLIASTLVVRQS